MVYKMPIDLVPNTNPPRFAWRQVIEGLDGERKVIDQTGALHPSVEKPVADLIALTKSLMRDNAMLQGQAESLHNKIDEQNVEIAAAEKAKSAHVASAAPTAAKKTGRQ